MQRISYIVCSFALLTTACNSGHWVDTPLLTAYLCDPEGPAAHAVKVAAEGAKAAQRIGVPGLAETPEQAKQEADQTLKLQAQGTCGQAGGAFTGDTRCENGGGQVKCK
jgi:hypothetical protein